MSAVSPDYIKRLFKVNYWFKLSKIEIISPQGSLVLEVVRKKCLVKCIQQIYFNASLFVITSFGDQCTPFGDVCSDEKNDVLQAQKNDGAMQRRFVNSLYKDVIEFLETIGETGGAYLRLSAALAKVGNNSRP